MLKKILWERYEWLARIAMRKYTSMEDKSGSFIFMLLAKCCCLLLLDLYIPFPGMHKLASLGPSYKFLEERKETL